MTDLPARQRYALAIAALLDGELDLAREGISSRVELIAWAKPRMQQTEQRGFALAQVAAAMQAGTRAGILSEEDMWHVLLVIAKLAQQTFASWDELAADTLRGRGRPQDLESLRVRWAELPWRMDLEVTLVDPTQQLRVLASTGPTCSAPRTRPSATAYVYCEFCGALMDYDIAAALSVPLAQPGPVYTQLHAQLAAELVATREHGDREAYRALQRRLFATWVEACPHAVPVRAKDPAYRDAYVAWLAEAQVVAGFDDVAREREDVMQATLAQLQFIAAGASVRVPAERFRALVEAMFAYEARRDELYIEHDVYAMHPDGASRELQRRIGWSMFVQAWLPMLEASEAAALLERTGLRCEYRLVPPAVLRTTSCNLCGGPLEIVDGAKRVVCDHCGRLAGVIAS